MSQSVDWQNLTWAQFRDRCYERWLPTLPTSAAYEQLQTLSMAGMRTSSVADYVAQFNRLLPHISLQQMTEWSRVQTFRHGLLPQLRLATSMLEAATLHEAQAHASRAYANIHPQRLLATSTSTSSQSAGGTSGAASAPRDTSGRFRPRGRGGAARRGRGGATAHLHTAIAQDDTLRTIQCDPSGSDYELLAAASEQANRNRAAWNEFSAKRTPEEMRRLVDERRCFKCCETGHQTPECTSKVIKK